MSENSERPDDSSHKIVTVATYPDSNQAAVAVGMLRAHGIEAKLLDVDAVSWYPVGNFGLGGVRVVVQTPDDEAARDLLRDGGFVDETDD